MVRRNVFAIVLLVGLVAAGSLTLTAAEENHEHSHDDDAIHEVKNVNVTIFNETMQEPDAFVLDVRSEEEFNKGHIEGAVRITSNELPNRDGELPKDKEAPVLVYCNSGRRSADVANTLLFMGYENVMNLEPGIKGWVKAGMPVV
ncbi:rhodanese domain-containing protein [Chloropicon primus]|uniref:Rhodanese domain-containing protein n=1 Tax=Chloropicon primus TaxID=1764295 RepID=A0A5B8MS94_9CHLO|nr:rhodanese domain-containing protein [Chloropicon primus]UPR02800.1 rhodanese domain-containing protein [Chloropicon primus]|mmetsp:Transcript_5573/g.16934  ORF Transcript_5573/g.16934 Transcript_5573/m.16934 type:complete len:145 (-) Transcript_5573:99-533(-)|eukprot:QDZ23588.1 rhodanese domain-containing protein [Chloropicon primus]